MIVLAALFTGVHQSASISKQHEPLLDLTGSWMSGVRLKVKGTTIPNLVWPERKLFSKLVL